MLKGVTRQVIVVRSPEGKLFEQAIFLLRDDSLSHGVGEQELLDEARRVASLYGAESTKRPGKLKRFMPLFWAAAGASPVALGWLLSALL